MAARPFLDPRSQAFLHWQRMPPGPDKALIGRIAHTPAAVWLYDSDLRRVREIAAAVRDAHGPDHGAEPMFVAYNIGNVDASGYRRWIDALAAAIRDLPCVVVLEPDHLPFRGMAAAAGLADAVGRLSQAGQARLYLDAGHPRWIDAGRMADWLVAAGIQQASGFSLNVSNYQRTADCVAYALQLRERIGAASDCLIDTSRNGCGPGTDPSDVHNLPTAGLGAPPGPIAAQAGMQGCWIKRPGESDGPEHGGPPAGFWWPEAALTLARNAPP